MEQINENVPETKEKPQIERAALGKLESEKISGWLRQLDESCKGYLTLSKSDVVNFLIREHKAELSAKEMSQIKNIHYDPIRHLAWISQELKLALSKNDLAKVAQLQSELKGIELSVISGATSAAPAKENAALEPAQPPKPRRKREPKSKLPNASEGLSIADLQENIPEA